jgi:hypothetical protein
VAGLAAVAVLLLLRIRRRFAGPMRRVVIEDVEAATGMTG